MVPFRSDGRGVSRRFAVILNDITRDKATTEELLENERTSSISCWRAAWRTSWAIRHPLTIHSGKLIGATPGKAEGQS